MSDDRVKHLNMSQEKRLNVAQEKILRDPARLTTKELDEIKRAAERGAARLAIPGGSGVEILRMVAEVRRLRALVKRLHGYMGAPIDSETQEELEREVLAQKEEERGGGSIP
jgi:hypothetical protein